MTNETSSPLSQIELKLNTELAKWQQKMNSKPDRMTPSELSNVFYLLLMSTTGELRQMNNVSLNIIADGTTRFSHKLADHAYEPQVVQVARPHDVEVDEHTTEHSIPSIAEAVESDEKLEDPLTLAANFLVENLPQINLIRLTQLAEVVDTK